VVRNHLAKSGFADIAMFAGSPPAIDAESKQGVAA
jgi:hypothetical protein